MSTTAQNRRRRAPSTAPRPKIALTIERVVRCAATVPELLSPDVSVAVSDLVRRAARSLEDSIGRPFRDVSCSSLANQALAETTEQLERALASLSVQFGARVVAPTTEAELAATARTLGLARHGDDPLTVLATHTDGRARLLLSVHRMARMQTWLMSNEPVRMLHATWDAVTDDDGTLAAPGALDATIAVHTSAGIDAERLAWAVIIAETHNQLGLIWLEANKLAPRYPGVCAEDLFGFGWQGLRAALRSYDPAVAAFSTYACPRINGAIRDGLRAEQPIPKRLTTLVNKVARAEDDLTQALGRAPELKELATRVGASMEKMSLLPRLTAAASVEELARHDDSDRDAAPAWLSDDTDPASDAIASLRRDAVEQALGQLPDDEAGAVRMLLLEGLAPGEAAARLGTTTRKLRASKTRGLEQLAGLLSEWAPSAA